MVYRVSSRTVKATQRNPVLKKTKLSKTKQKMPQNESEILLQATDFQKVILDPF